jgi:hypothetical protein
MSQAVSDGVTFSDLDVRQRYSANVSRDAPGSLMAIPTIAVYPRDKDSASMQEGIPAQKSKTTTTGHNDRSHGIQTDLSVPVAVSSIEKDIDGEDMESELVISGDGEEDHDVDVDIEMADELCEDPTLGPSASETLTQTQVMIPCSYIRY